MHQLHALMLMHHGRPEDTKREIDAILAEAAKVAQEATREIEAMKKDVS